VTRRAHTACLLAGLALLGVSAPAVATAQAPPSVSAPSALVVEASTGDELFAKAADKRRAIASTTKLMTALLVLERAKPSTIIPAARYRALPVESKIGLRAGERMTVADLLRGLLVGSANDAAATLADGVGGSRAAFVRAMNLRARQLGLKGTHYANPIGLDAPGNYSTARDLARLTLRLRRFAFFRRTVARPSVTLRSGDRPRTISNRNKLVGLPEINGVKTGHTGGAGWVLVGSGSRRGITLVSVVLGAASEAARQADTRKLLDWGFGRYKRVRAVEPGVVLARVPIRYRRGAELALVTGSGGRRIVVRSEERLRRCGVRTPAEVTGPIRRGQRLGTVEVCRGTTRVAQVALIAAAAVPVAGMGQQTKDWFTRPFSLLVVVLAVLAGTVLLTTLRGRGSNSRRRARREPEAA
jgi:serine-type D-Ala-D-Ala carboxypeptidase (penicillin-binding protein 5/6)